MSEQLTTITIAGFALVGAAIFTLAALKAWRGWLELKRLELGSGQGHVAASRGPVAERIEVADLRERIRKLESLAACIDL
ncbi:MAG: hypothetical protein JOZ90_13470 [Alphaproteobacteria bacterium]|nr:hypothetical protein [Alphaproteobacteria bacterium]MBV9372893.1 hypothetical protein [Alphaproteobacteria bacterium]MBV9902081.1 hypothetical protein [Alphaproteobacteria bacterium]